MLAGLGLLLFGALFTRKTYKDMAHANDYQTNEIARFNEQQREKRMRAEALKRLESKDKEITEICYRAELKRSDENVEVRNAKQHNLQQIKDYVKGKIDNIKYIPIPKQQTRHAENQ